MSAPAGRLATDEAVVVDVRDLRIDVLDKDVDIVDEVSLQISAGKVLGLVGESGCGKTTIGMALLGHCRHGAGMVSGSIHVDGTDLMTVSVREMDSIRGRVVAYIPQDPPTALNPVLRIGTQLREMLDTHLPEVSARDRDRRLRETLREASLPEDDHFLRRYAHQLSGGQQQRAALAMAFLCRPRVIVCDEPTTGLDVSTQARVLQTVRELAQIHRSAVLYVSHDLAVVSALADRVAVMYAGRVVESGTRDQIFGAPAHPYTRQLLNAVPEINSLRPPVGIAGYAPLPGARPAGCFYWPRCPWTIDRCRAEFPGTAEFAPGHVVRCHRAFDGLSIPSASTLLTRAPAGDIVLSARDITARYRGEAVVHDASFDLRSHDCLAIVGESGSGKTTLARCIVGLHREYSGGVILRGVELSLSARRRSDDQRRQVQYIFQNPFASLNPRRTVGDSIAMPLRLFLSMGKKRAWGRVSEMLDRVSLASSVMTAYPEQLSGGERQRAAIARALAAEPAVLICDEITSALDVSVQAAIIDLLASLRKEMGLSMLFITHNLAVVRVLADQVVVLSDGRIVEAAPTDQIFNDPQAPYTQSLLSNTPTLSGTPTLISTT